VIRHDEQIMVRCEPSFKRERHALIEENSHQAATRLGSACRRTSTPARVSRPRTNLESR
jgi:hypothetical protein